MRLTIDTNILISSLITKTTPPALLYHAWREGKYELITSQEQMIEIARALKYPKLRKYINAYEDEILLDCIMQEALIVNALNEVSYSPDKADNMIIATAIAGNADYIVTGDKRDLLVLKEVAGIPIITARQALSMFGLS